MFCRNLLSRRRKKSSFSEEKEAKRLFIVLSRIGQQTRANKQKFFGSFFQKRTLSFTLIRSAPSAASAEGR
jgi:hypothetical protein